MDQRGYSEPTENDLADRLASRVSAWSRIAAARLAQVPAQTTSTALS
ncbi:hypothetical protein [Cellulomonas sp. NPDC089187]